jgi:hypothetical protein
MNLKNNSLKLTGTWRSIPLLAAASLLFFSSCKDEGPTVAINYPSEAEVILQGTAVTIDVEATDVDGSLFTKAGISSVQFEIDDILVSTVNSSPYTYIWDTYWESLGNHTITVTAIDNGDNQAVEDIQVTINDAPYCAITNPIGSAYQETTVAFEVDATDDLGGVTSVDFYLDNSLLGSDVSSPYSYSWNVGATSLGYHTLKAVATDYYGQETTAESTIEVKVVLITGTWQGEYSGYDSQVGENVTFRRELIVNTDKTYSNTLYGRPDSYSSDITFEEESGTWEVNDAGTQVAWDPTIYCRQMDISDPSTLVDWARGEHYEQIELSNSNTTWAVRDETLSIDYYIQKQ